MRASGSRACGSRRAIGRWARPITVDLVDVVVMDDFLYSEPVAIPEPTSVVLSIVGLAGGAFLLCRRRK